MNREISATMNINKNISEYVIIKGSGLLTEILSVSDVNQYPLDWTAFNKLPLPSEVTLTVDPTFSGLGTNHDFTTHIVPTNANAVNDTVLRQLNTLNSIWKQFNRIKIGKDEKGIGKNEKGIGEDLWFNYRYYTDIYYG